MMFPLMFRPCCHFNQIHFNFLCMMHKIYICSILYLGLLKRRSKSPFRGSNIGLSMYKISTNTADLLKMTKRRDTAINPDFNRGKCATL